MNVLIQRSAIAGGSVPGLVAQNELIAEGGGIDGLGPARETD